MSMESHRVIEVFKTIEEFEQKAAEEIIRATNQAIRDRGVCFLALSGGETPRRVYRRLGTEHLKNQVNWKCVYLFFSDERSVPQTDPQSNFGMARLSLISQVDIPQEQVHRMKGEINPTVAAEEYEREIHEAFGERQVRFDLVLLGVGEDGHTASIFPGTSIVKEKRALARALFVPRLNSWRVTLTFGAINNAREVLFLASGKQKAAIVRCIVSASEPTEELPATMVQPVDGTLRWMIDEEAASELKSGGGS